MKEITFYRLNGLTPTVESCTMKVIEELGELTELIGKGNRASGEKHHLYENERVWAARTIQEALDVAQSAVTMAFVLAEKHDVPLKQMLDLHRAKLETKGYLIPQTPEIIPSWWRICENCGNQGTGKCEECEGEDDTPGMPTNWRRLKSFGNMSRP